MSEISSGLVAFCYMSDQYEVALFSEPPTDPLYDDMFPVVRLSDAEAIIAQKDAEIERLKQTPTIEDAKTTVEHLRAYAADNGYSHGDYADVMTEAANQIEKQAERIKELESEVLDQCRLNGMGAERELALRGQMERQSAALKLAREALERSSKRDIAQWHNWDFDGDDDGKPPTQLNDPVLQAQLQALAAINEVLEGE